LKSRVIISGNYRGGATDNIPGEVTVIKPKPGGINTGDSTALNPELFRGRAFTWVPAFLCTSPIINLRS
jgi:hypothetical protein